MKYAKIPVYEFEELDREVKDRVLARHMERFGYSWANDALASLHALANHFGGRLVNYNIDFFGFHPSSAIFEAPDLDEETLGNLVEELGNGEGKCVLTGYCADEDAIDGVRHAYQAGERNVLRLLQAGFRTWLKACQNDCMSEYSDEHFSETARANGWLFMKDGTLVPYDAELIS